MALRVDLYMCRWACIELLYAAIFMCGFSRIWSKVIKQHKQKQQEE